MKLWNLAASVSEWAIEGCPKVSEELFFNRLEICKSCLDWDQSGFAGSGKCKKCGCSTQAKLRMATAKCPVEKWGKVDISTQ